MENYNELEEMRQQMAILKSKLEEQTIINEKMLHKAMKKRVGWINRNYMSQMIFILFFAMPYCWWSFKYLMDMSTVFMVATELLLLYCFIYTYWCGRPMRDDMLMEGDMLQVAETVTKAKKRDGDWLMQGIPLGIIWFAWWMYEIYVLHNNIALCICGTVGGIIGGAIGFSIHLKTQRKYREILEDIEDMRNS